MIYEVKNRTDARHATYTKEAPTTAIISITDLGSKLNRFYPQPWLLEVLELQFEDVEAPHPKCMSKKQAKEIADFARRMYPQVERFIVHCEFGQSRSAGVCAAISQYFEGNSGGIFGNRAYYPNRTCYRYVLDALNKKKRR